MRARRWRAAVLLTGLLLGGCGEDAERDEEVIEEGIVPPGAIPAAPDVRPGSEAGAGEVLQSDTAAAGDTLGGA